MKNENLPKEIEGSQFNGDKSLIGEETTSKQKDLEFALSEQGPQGPNHFEKINLLSGIDENKLAEIEQADIVLIYKDNNTFNDMSNTLQNLVEQEYGGKVYCITIPQGTENLKDSDIEILKKIINNSRICYTDLTTSKWTGREDELYLLDSWIEYNYESKESMRELMYANKKLEEKLIKKGINILYVYVPLILGHGGFIQREDGTLYDVDESYMESLYRGEGGKEVLQKYVYGAKRFWKNAFPNLKVEFIEKDDSENLNKYETKGSILIAETDAHPDVKRFGGTKIFYIGNRYEPRKYDIDTIQPGESFIDEFLDETDYNCDKGEILARTIMYEWRVG